MLLVMRRHFSLPCGWVPRATYLEPLYESLSCFFCVKYFLVFLCKDTLRVLSVYVPLSYVYPPTVPTPSYSSTLQPHYRFSVSQRKPPLFLKILTTTTIYVLRHLILGELTCEVYPFKVPHTYCSQGGIGSPYQGSGGRRRTLNLVLARGRTYNHGR